MIALQYILITWLLLHLFVAICRPALSLWSQLQMWIKLRVQRRQMLLQELQVVPARRWSGDPASRTRTLTHSCDVHYLSQLTCRWDANANSLHLLITH